MKASFICETRQKVSLPAIAKSRRTYAFNSKAIHGERMLLYRWDPASTHQRGATSVSHLCLKKTLSRETNTSVSP